MKTNDPSSTPDSRHGWCPVYDTPCPQGNEAAEACNDRVDPEYDPMNNLRDAAITFCAIQRADEGYGVREPGSENDPITQNINQRFDSGETP